MSKDEWKKLTKNEWTKWVGVVGRMLLAYALVFAQGAWATQNQGTEDKSGSPQKAAQQANEKQSAGSAKAAAKTEQAQGEESQSVMAEEKPSRDGSHEGIKVHGHWTIEVRDPDGRVATHREFENSLIGGLALIRFLARQNTVGAWTVQLMGNVCSGASSCNIIEPAVTTGTDSSDFNNLSVTAPIGQNNLVLSGSAVAALTGTITAVQTLVGLCLPSAPCGISPGGTPFTSRPLDGQNGDPQGPISVSSGQTIAVTVTISFS